MLSRPCAVLMPSASRHQEATLTLARCAEAHDVGATLLLLRLVERMRRAICRAYGLPLETLSPESAFVSRIPCGASNESYGRLHADESSNAAFHYSAVLYLTTQGEDFEGGDFNFRISREYTVSMKQGDVIFFPSYFPHKVTPVTKGTRYSLVAWFVGNPLT